MINTYLIHNILEIGASMVIVLQRPVHAFIGLGIVVSCDPFLHNILKDMGIEMHFGKIPIFAN